MAKSFSILQGINGLDDFPPSWNVCADVKVSCGFLDVWHYCWYGYDGTELQDFSIALEQATNTITSIHYMNDLSRANFLRQLWEKLPRYPWQ